MQKIADIGLHGIHPDRGLLEQSLNALALWRPRRASLCPDPLPAISKISTDKASTHKNSIRAIARVTCRLAFITCQAICGSCAETPTALELSTDAWRYSGRAGESARREGLRNQREEKDILTWQAMSCTSSLYAIEAVMT